MADLVAVSWYATVLRQESFAAEVARIAPVALRYGATQYQVHVSNDDRYKITQMSWFDSKTGWYRYWDGPEMIEFRRRNSRGQMGCNRRKNVTAVKCSADRLQKIALIRDMPHFRLFAREDHGEHSVVGSDEILPAPGLCNDGTPLGADAGINDADKDRADRKVKCRTRQEALTLRDGVRRHLVGEIDNARIWRDAEHDSLAYGDCIIERAEVCQKHDDRSVRGVAGIGAIHSRYSDRKKDE